MCMSRVFSSSNASLMRFHNYTLLLLLRSWADGTGSSVRALFRVGGSAGGRVQQQHRHFHPTIDDIPAVILEKGSYMGSGVQRCHLVGRCSGHRRVHCYDP